MHSLMCEVEQCPSAASSLPTLPGLNRCATRHYAIDRGLYCASDDFALAIGQLSQRPTVHVGMGVQSFLQQADEAAQTGDVHAAEKLLHRYFDFNGNDPLLSVASKGSSSSTSQQALAALHHAKDPQFTGTRHQQALLQLASMWSCSGHYSLAMAAVEEAMKKRGDVADTGRHNNYDEETLLKYRRQALEYRGRALAREF